MLNNFKLPAFILMIALISSCNNKPGLKESQEVKSLSESKSITPVDKNTDDLVSFISGIPVDENACLSKLDTAVKWKKYSRELESMFAHTNSFRIEKMKSWADSELVRTKDIKTVFYPFSGPDFLNADIFYPEADQYIMIGLESIGYLPDVCKMIPDSVNSYLNTINNSLKDIFKRSYFITSKMSTDLQKTKVNGTIPLISLFIKRTGHQIVSIQRIAVDSLGKWQIVDSFKNKRRMVAGVKIDFLSLSREKVQTVFYFRTDISDKGLAKTPGFKNYLSQLPKSYSYLKAASYLMHSDNFKIIRNTIFDISSSILQDDSGIAYRYFDKSAWDIRLYGKYLKPRDEFKYISEPDLQKAYNKTTVRPLTYTLGYNWGVGHSNLLYAIRK
jgi:hypothetical protein